MARVDRKAREARVEEASKQWLSWFDRLSIRGARLGLARALDTSETLDVIAVGFFGKMKGAIAIAGDRLLICSSTGAPYEIQLTNVARVDSASGILGGKLAISTRDGRQFDLTALSPKPAEQALVRRLRDAARRANR